MGNTRPAYRYKKNASCRDKFGLHIDTLKPIDVIDDDKFGIMATIGFQWQLKETCTYGHLRFNRLFAMMSFTSSCALYWHGLTVILKINHMRRKVWDEITHPFPNFNSVEVWEGMSNFIPTLYDGCNYLSMLVLQLNRVSKRGLYNQLIPMINIRCVTLWHGQCCHKYPQQTPKSAPVKEIYWVYLALQSLI